MVSPDRRSSPAVGPFTRFIQLGDCLFQLAFLLPYPTNVWLVMEDDGLTVIDTAYPHNVPDILAVARFLQQPVRRVLLTHAHPDHAGDAALLAQKTGAEVRAHPDDIPYLLGQKSMADEPGGWLCRQVLTALQSLRLLAPPRLAHVEATTDGDRVGRLLVLHSPGHTPGSSSFWDADDHALFCGDNAGFTFWALHLGVPWFTLNVPQRNDSIRRYLQFPVRRLLAGHGPVYEGDVPATLQRLLPGSV